MSESVKNYRLSLKRPFYCSVTYTIKPEMQQEVTKAQNALRELEVSIGLMRDGSRLIEISSKKTESEIKNAVGEVYSVYEIPKPWEIKDISPSYFMP